MPFSTWGATWHSVGKAGSGPDLPPRTWCVLSTRPLRPTLVAVQVPDFHAATCQLAVAPGADARALDDGDSVLGARWRAPLLDELQRPIGRQVGRCSVVALPAGTTRMCQPGLHHRRTPKVAGGERARDGAQLEFLRRHAQPSEVAIHPVERGRAVEV